MAFCSAEENCFCFIKDCLSYDVPSESEIAPCIKIFLQIFWKRYEMTLLTSGYGKTLTFLHQKYDFKIILMPYDK